MEDIAEFIRSLGNLHDSTLLGLHWRPVEKRLEMDIKDIYWNFEGLPEYAGPTRATFVFSQVTGLHIDVDLTEIGLMVHDWEFKPTDKAEHNCEILFSPAGKIFVQCAQIECVRTAVTA